MIGFGSRKGRRKSCMTPRRGPWTAPSTKYVTVASANSPRWVQVGLPIASSSPVSLGSPPSAVGSADPEVEPEGRT